MTALRTMTRVLIPLASSVGLGACGRELSMEPRQAITPDSLVQIYEVSILGTEAGISGYMATASFEDMLGAEPANMPLPTGDTVTVNGTAMTESSAANYTASGTGSPASLEFVWTHGDTAYTNKASIALYQPSSVPTTVSRSGGTTIDVAGVPTGVSIAAAVNAGSQVAPPFAYLPVTVTGGGRGQSGSGSLTFLASGPGVLVLQETWDETLQAPTAAGGSMLMTVQLGYNVTITD